MLENLKGLLGSACCCEDGTLNALLETAVDTILDYIGRDELPPRLESVVVQYAVILYNQMGAEGETSRSQGGVSQSFLNDLPPALLRRLKQYPRKVRVISSETPE
ncbi:MAG: phage head-tail connector protein [Oscillospiraceae bacterium]|nr:phage head-tail connector protein [Oscillospiraceae bacterium]